MAKTGIFAWCCYHTQPASHVAREGVRRSNNPFRRLLDVENALSGWNELGLKPVATLSMLMQCHAWRPTHDQIKLITRTTNTATSKPT